MSETDNDSNFSIPLNVAGVTAATGDSFLPEGYYRGVVTKMVRKNPTAEEALKGKNPRVQIQVKVTEGDHKNVLRTTSINLPKDANDGVRAYWRAFLESLGYGPAELDNGEITVTQAACVDKPTCFYYMPAPIEGGNDVTRFLPPAKWDEGLATFEPGKLMANEAKRQAAYAAKKNGGAGALSPNPAVGGATLQGPTGGLAGGIGGGLAQNAGGLAGGGLASGGLTGGLGGGSLVGGLGGGGGLTGGAPAGGGLLGRLAGA